LEEITRGEHSNWGKYIRSLAGKVISEEETFEVRFKDKKGEGYLARSQSKGSNLAEESLDETND
jgi:hypothetical protein